MACDKNPEKIKNLFDEIASCYDKTNNFISLGTHYVLKYLALKELQIKPRSMVLDLCCGTGDFTKLVTKFYPRVKIIGLDFSKNMIQLAKEKNPRGVFMHGDCTALPFGDKEFKYITMGFGLRNIQDRQKAISEVYRVLDRGGKFLHLDFGIHKGPLKLFDFIVPLSSKILKTNPEHYKYLISSKNTFPEPDELIQEFSQAGFSFNKRCDYLFGAISAQIMLKE